MAENTQSVLERTAADQWKVLPSGLTVLVRPMPGYSGTHVIYATRFGSIDRDFRLGEREVHLPAGVAHFLEHKMFEDEDGDAFAKFAKTGANANAFTAFDRTCYLFTATEQLDESLDVLLGMVGHPYFTEQTIAKEQGIIGQEIKMYDDSPDWRLITGLCECLYHSHPIRSDIAGTVESIAEITPEMLYDCCKAFYAPGNMVLAAAGNTSMEQILAACARHGLMDERPAEKVERLLRPEPMTLAAAEKTIAMPIAKSCFGLGFKEEPLPFGDLRSEMLYELILCCICGGMSPLYRRLYDEGLTNPGFGGEVLRVDGCCCILFTGESDQPDTVRQLLLDEIERVRREGVDREIFTLCKNEKYGQLIENLENVEDSASQMADFALAGQTVAQQITMLAGLTAEDADAALQHILRPERMAVMYIEPDGTAVEDEEEEETDQLQLSDENKKILEEMDKGGKNKKGKKQKKPKKEKQPKPKKPAKEKKKKEKPEKEVKPSVSEKKLSPKKILPIVVVCISLGAVILLLGNFLADYTAKRSGREAYYAGDYQTCYQNLMGKELDETEQVMYSQSESILTIRMWLREYEVFVNEGSELEALDSLLQAVRDYPTLLNYATQWNAQDEVSLAFQDILNILSQKYQLSQEEAQQIADISDNVEYTKNVMLVLQRLGLGFWEFPQGTVTEETSAPNTEEAPAQLPDPLPEEEEIQQ